MNEWVCLRNGHFVRGKDEGGASLFFLLFNADGTCSLACKDWKQNLWFVYNYFAGLYRVGEYKNGSGSPVAHSRFRMVPTSNGYIWIFEPTANEVVAVGSDAHLVRWNPYEQKTQLFRLQAMGPISAGDQGEIKRHWPHFGTIPWWGN